MAKSAPESGMGNGRKWGNRDEGGSNVADGNQQEGKCKKERRVECLGEAGQL